jgi:hypothetical protein
MTDTVAPTATETGTLPYHAITHTCGAWWTGTGRSHCPACCRTFSCDSAADKHRIGKFGIDRRCTDPAEVGLVAVDKPYGVMWQHPGPEDGRDTRRTDDA